uniref:Uncharacterized protein n=1 Tax=Cannabis sativa TaxID=3483 RepID=A0A803NJH0_CANSA
MERELGHQLTTYDRCDLWNKLHTNKKGELNGPAQEVAKRITVELLKQLLQVVQGQQSGVADTSHTSGSGVGRASNEPASATRASTLGVELPRVDTTSVPAPSTKDYSPPRPPTIVRASAPPAPSSDTSDKCSLHVIDPNIEGDGLVAFGYVKFEKTNDKGEITVHGEKKKYCDFKHVFVEKVINENASMPCPLKQEGFYQACLAVQHFVFWPKKLIKIPPARLVQKWHKKKIVQYELKPDLFGLDHECRIDKDVLDVCELGWLKDDKPYNNQEINKIRDEWGSFVKSYLLKE